MRDGLCRAGTAAGLLLTGAALCRWPAESAAAVRSALGLCGDVLVPALFPFFVLSSLLIATGVAGACARPLRAVMRPLFGLSGAAAAAVLLGAVGGYPVGARTAAELAARGDCAPEEGRRLALFCNQCGPAFFLGAAGVGVFGSRQAGFLLMGCVLGAGLLVGIGLRLVCGPVPAWTGGRRAAARQPLAEVLPECVRGGFSATLGVCSYVLLFSVLAELATCSGALPILAGGLARLCPGAGAEVLCRSGLIGLLELSTGVAGLREATSAPAALPLCAFLLGWGGLSVHCQSLPFLRTAGASLRSYLLAKLAQGALAAALTAAAARIVPLAAPVLAAEVVHTGPGPLGRLTVLLWALVGLSFLAFGKKRVEKTGRS